uniref:POU-specific domain-containing protein n=1 Tax=Timema shepardi TaxID=629360 RepID=A0A7R9FY56_TIMSH|nr:unnamed protein product [Timema shepardi]
MSMLVWRALVVTDRNLRAAASFPRGVLMLGSVYVFFPTRSSRQSSGEMGPTDSQKPFGSAGDRTRDLCFSNQGSCESNPPSPEPATMGLDGAHHNHGHHFMANGHSNNNNSSSSPSSNGSMPGTPTHNHSGHASPDPGHGVMDAAKAAAHLNGTMAGMVTLQNLQNLATLQSLPQVASLAAGLQGIAGLGTQLINTPLNLSASATSNLSCPTSSAHTVGNLLGSASQPQLLAAPQPAAMPQLILASGQLVQGIQGAQLLIPTSQGKYLEESPMEQKGIATQTILTIPVNHVTSGQMVNLALSNGQVVTTTLANLQTLAQPHHLLTPPSAVNTVPSPNPVGLGLNPTANSLPHLLTNGVTVSQHQQLLNAMQQPQMVPPPQPLSTPTQHSSGPSHPPQQRSSHNHHYSIPEKHHPNGVMNSSESSISAITRLAANNSDITITSTHPAPQNLHKSSLSMHTSSNGSSQHNRSSPPVDFLADSPNQPTINQTNSNVVDGINLDEIKEFAKAFKLRRLSLGLTQTQVGQALSITEGPAYSQSAICSGVSRDLSNLVEVELNLSGNQATCRRETGQTQQSWNTVWPVGSQLAVELNMTSALANYATEAGYSGKGGRIEGREGWRTLQTRGEVRFKAHIEARSTFAKLRRRRKRNSSFHFLRWPATWSSFIAAWRRHTFSRLVVFGESGGRWSS